MGSLAHAKLSASGAHRWMGCPASVMMEEGLPDETSPFALEGTAAHALAEQCLRTDINADNYLNTNVEGVTVDEEMVESVQRYLDYVRALPGIRFIEQRVDFSPWVPGGFGTADTLILDGKTVTVVDLKYGKGVKVDADKNRQAMLYALGASNDYSFLETIETFCLSIVQPRLDHVSEWAISKKDLLEWAEDCVKPAAHKALSKEPTFQPGPTQCRFCKAKGHCKALAQYHLKTASEGFSSIEDPLTFKDNQTLNDDELGTLLTQSEDLQAWLTALKGEAFSRLEKGTPVPGYKLVKGRSSRAWADPEKAENALRNHLNDEDIFTQKLISPTQAEKKLNKEIYADIRPYVIKPEGKPSLAPSSDKRPALDMDPASGFSSIASVQ